MPGTASSRMHTPRPKVTVSLHALPGQTRPQSMQHMRNCNFGQRTQAEAERGLALGLIKHLALVRALVPDHHLRRQHTSLSAPCAVPSAGSRDPGMRGRSRVKRSACWQACQRWSGRLQSGASPVKQGPQAVAQQVPKREPSQVDGLCAVSISSAANRGLQDRDHQSFASASSPWNLRFTPLRHLHWPQSPGCVSQRRYGAHLLPGLGQLAVWLARRELLNGKAVFKRAHFAAGLARRAVGCTRACMSISPMVSGHLAARSQGKQRRLACGVACKKPWHHTMACNEIHVLAYHQSVRRRRLGACLHI
jgi:hypothetical protein